MSGDARRVFVSHTSEMSSYPRDRSLVRQAVSAIRGLEHVAIEMDELGWARSRPAADVCRGQVERCDAYVLIAGFRYGTLVPDAPSPISYTELEYDAAVEAGLPVLVFRLDPGLQDWDARLRPASDEDTQRQERFVAKASAGIVRETVRDPYDFALALGMALMRLWNESADRAPAVLDADLAQGRWASPGGLHLLARDRFRLDAIACVGTAPFTAVVCDVDPGREPLATALNGAAGAAARSGIHRTWFEARGADLGASPGAELAVHLADATGWGELPDSTVGLVVRVDGVGPGDAGDGRASVVAALRGLRRALPRAALLVHVTGTVLPDAARAGDLISTAVGTAGQPVPLFAARPADPPGGRGAGASGAGGLASLRAAVRAALAARDLGWPDEGEADDGPVSPARVVAELDTAGYEPERELALLRAARFPLADRWPALLEAHAERRSGAARLLSLAAAAGAGVDVGSLLDRGPVPDPDDAYAVGVLTEVSDAVLLALLRKPDDVVARRRWVARGGRPAREMAERLDLGRDGSLRFRPTDVDTMRDRERIALVARAAAELGFGIERLGPGSERAPFFWALAARSPLTPAALDRLGNVTGYPRHVLDGEDPDDHERHLQLPALRAELPHTSLRGPRHAG